MMNSATLRLVLLVSCAHALVHVYEHSFSSVEQLIAAEYHVGKEVTGTMGMYLRMPFGLFALAAGWLADRFGAKRLLLLYLFGCSAAAAGAWFAPSLALLSLMMFTLGTFASIYHPAGVGLISHHTIPRNRPMALGYHGIIGSIGIAAGPFLAGAVLATGASWRQYYLILAVPGVVLGVLLMLRLAHEQENLSVTDAATAAADREDHSHWASYALLMVMTSLAGIVFAAILTFLPRYLDKTGLHFDGVSPESLRNYLTGVVLLLGIVGQYAGGRMGRPHTLELLMAGGFYAATPLVFWMGHAQGMSRFWAAGLFAPLFFMHQPLFNSLVAKYVPRRRRSLCYGLSFTFGFGIGSYGPRFAGQTQSEPLLYGTLSVLLGISATLALILWWWNRPGRDS